MSEARAIFSHSRVYSLGAILNRGAGFLLLPLYTHSLVPGEYGLLGVIAITSEVVGAVIGIKLGTAMSRLYFDYDEEKEQAELVSTAVVGLGSIAAASGLLLALIARPLAAVVLADGDQGDLLLLGIAGLLFNVIFTLGLQYLIVLQRSRMVLVVSTLRSLVYLALTTLLLAFLEMGLFGALLGLLLANALAAAGLLLPLLVRLGVRFSMPKFLAMLGFGAPLLPAQLAELLIRFSDRYLLVQLASLASTGIFFLALRLAAMLQMALVSPFNQIYLVRRFQAHGRHDADAEAPRVFTYFFTLVVSGALALSLLAPQLVALLAFRRPAYAGAAAAIPLLALAEVVRSVVLMAEIGIFYAKISRYLTYATLAMFLFHVPVTAAMISAFGVVGAAGAIVLSTTFRLLVTWRLARGLGGPRPQWGQLVVILAAGAALFGLVAAGELALGPISGLVLRLTVPVAFPLLVLASPLYSSAEREALRGFAMQRLGKQREASSRVAVP